MNQDAGSIGILMDNKKQALNTFKQIETKLEEYKTAELSTSKEIENKINMQFKSITVVLTNMKLEVNNLTSDDKEREYRDLIIEYKAKQKQLQEALTKARIEKNNKGKTGGLNVEDIELNEIKDKPIHEMNAQEVMDKGDEILNEDEAAINRMIKRLGETKDVSKQIRLNQQKQIDQLTNTRKNLQEMDYSLKRANKTLKNMLKSYATDKIVLGLIVIIVLIILALIIVAAVGGDPEGNFLAPHDIFGNKNVTTTDGQTVTTLRRLI